MKKKLFLLAFAFFAASVYALDVTKTETGNNGLSIWCRTAENISIGIGTEPKELIRTLKVSGENGAFVLDAREFFKQPNARKIVTRFYRRYKIDEFRGKMLNASVQAEAQDAGEINIYLEGNRGKENKHFYFAKTFPVSSESETFTVTHPAPEDMNNICIRADLHKSAVYRIKSAKISVKQEEKVDSSVNHILNGGAERGWYATGINGFEFLKMADNNLISDGRNHFWDKELKVALDDKVKRSGNYSFRLTREPKSYGRFNLNPVPFVVGKSASFSCWVKGERPNQQIDIGLFLGNGQAYSKQFRVGTEWTRCELFIPEWGKKPEGIYMFGNPATGYASVTNFVSPHLSSLGGTIWIDDAAYSIGGHSKFTPETGILLSAKIDEPKGYYRPGTPVQTELTLRNTAGKAENAEIRWEMKDFFGKTVMSGNAGKIKVEAKGTAKRTVSVTPPENLRGAANLLFNVGGKQAGVYFGVAEKPGKLSHRIGVNYTPGSSNIHKAIPLLKDFRIGALRLWSTYRATPNTGFRDVEEFHKNGFYLMMCYGSEGFAPWPMIPKDFTAWRKKLNGFAAQYRGKIQIYEMLNETNIWGGRMKNPDPSKYYEMTPEVNALVIRELSEAVKAGDPDAKVAGPASCHTDIAWTSSMLAKGGAKGLDVITEHPYRQLPELPDYEPELQTLQKVADKYKPGFPVTATEAGERSFSLFPDNNRIPGFERQRVAYNTRMMLIGFGNGLQQYYHFTFTMDFEGCGWGFLLQGNPDNGRQPMPAPVMFACKNAADRLEDAKPAGRVKLGFNYRCYIFDRGDKRVAALWKWNGKPTRTPLPAELKNAAVYDVMGTEIKSGEIELSEFPVYLETELSAAELATAIRKTDLNAGTNLFDANAIVVAEREIKVRILNLGTKPLAGTVETLGRKQSFPAIAPEEFGEVSFRLPSPVSLKNNTVQATVRTGSGAEKKFRWNLRAILAPRAEKAPVIDGDLSDWNAQAKEIPLSLRTRLKPWTSAEDAIRANAQLMWDDAHLYLGVTVFKRDNVESPVGVSGLWHGDGIQFAFDPIRNALKEVKDYQDDDFEYAAALVSGKPVIFRTKASAATYDSLEKEIGLLQDVPVAIRRYPDRTIYEFAFPRQSVSPFRLESGSSMRMNVLVNIGTKNGRAGFLQLTPGIGENPKRPGLFMDLVLMP